MAAPCLVTCVKQGVRKEFTEQGNGLAADVGSVCGPVHLREGGLSCKDRNTCGILGETRQKGERKQKALHGQTPALSAPSEGSVRQVQD